MSRAPSLPRTSRTSIPLRKNRKHKKYKFMKKTLLTTAVALAAFFCTATAQDDLSRATRNDSVRAQRGMGRNFRQGQAPGRGQRPGNFPGQNPNMQMPDSNAVQVKTVRFAGPYKVMKPFVIDSVDAQQMRLPADNALNTQLSLKVDGTPTDIANAPKEQGQLALAAFRIASSKYANATVKVMGPRQHRIYINGMEHRGVTPLQPGMYDVVVKFVCDTTDLKISVTSNQKEIVTVVDEKANTKRSFNMNDNMLMKHYNGVSISPSGKYASVSSVNYDVSGRTQPRHQIIETATGKMLHFISGQAMWMPRTDRYLVTRQVDGKTHLISVDPATMNEKTICTSMTGDRFFMSPTEDFLILTQNSNGPAKETGVYEVISPDDRQPGWRNRSKLSMMRLDNGLVQPLTYSNKNVHPVDMSQDGKTLYFSVSESRLEKRPTSVTSLYRMNLETLESECIVEKEGFASDYNLIPNTSKFIVVGCAEAFNRIGCILPDSVIPNFYEKQLFLLDADTKKVTPLTRDFDPSIERLVVGKDGYAYFTADKADSVNLYRMDLKNFRISKIEQPTEVIASFALASQGSNIIYYGTGACTDETLSLVNTKNLKLTQLEQLNTERLAEIDLGTCKGFSFKSERGYNLTGHYYLPAHFDENKKYPVIVYYYGGCSPMTRRFGNGAHYAAHLWNSLGYVVVIVNASGAYGFGQEWAARHVNTAGEGPAQDVIETAKWFAKNKWADEKKFGCLSASYGGFLTQYILTKTDFFACGISHAGISDHTSYWGEGYWGYSYSEISMADSYPWTRKDLYVDRSPLFNADKIHTPLLFTHGTADTNVPIGESIQMYNALKLLGRPTAFIMVEGENHHIMEYNKRIKWINSMNAWFEKYLKGDNTWWNAMYPEKKL